MRCVQGIGYTVVNDLTEVKSCDSDFQSLFLEYQESEDEDSIDNCPSDSESLPDAKTTSAATVSRYISNACITL